MPSVLPVGLWGSVCTPAVLSRGYCIKTSVGLWGTEHRVILGMYGDSFILRTKWIPWWVKHEEHWETVDHLMENTPMFQALLDYER